MNPLRRSASVASAVVLAFAALGVMGVTTAQASAKQLPVQPGLEGGCATENMRLCALTMGDIFGQTMQNNSNRPGQVQGTVATAGNNAVKSLARNVKG